MWLAALVGHIVLVAVAAGSINYDFAKEDPEGSAWLKQKEVGKAGGDVSKLADADDFAKEDPEGSAWLKQKEVGKAGGDVSKLADAVGKAGKAGPPKTIMGQLAEQLVNKSVINACHNDNDYNIWENGTHNGSSTFHDDINGCSQKCWGRTTCVNKCIKERRGYTDLCAGCFGELSCCMVMHCWFPCMSGESADCQKCSGKLCSKRFAKCTGIPDDEIHGSSLSLSQGSPLAGGRRLTELPVKKFDESNELHI